MSSLSVDWYNLWSQYPWHLFIGKGVFSAVLLWDKLFSVVIVLLPMGLFKKYPKYILGVLVDTRGARSDA